MTLEVDRGARLDLQPPLPPDPGDRLDDSRTVEQLAEFWCWAASVASARDTLGVAPRPQHLIVARHLGVDPGLCETTPNHVDCNRRIQRGELECLWQREGFGKAEFREAILSFEDIKEEIAADRPVQLEIGNRHVILVVGWRVDEMRVQIVEIVDTDGSSPPLEWNFRDLDAYLDYGSWQGTCVFLEFDGSTTCHA